MRFIDENSECLCPIVLSHGLVLELELKGGEKINCEIVLPSKNPIALNSSLFLSDLVSIEVEPSPHIRQLPSLESLAPKHFNMSIFNSKFVFFIVYYM